MYYLCNQTGMRFRKCRKRSIQSSKRRRSRKLNDARPVAVPLRRCGVRTGEQFFGGPFLDALPNSIVKIIAEVAD
jgi:hypothetical protein